MSEQVSFSLSPTVLALICVCIKCLTMKMLIVLEHTALKMYWREKCKILTVRIGYKVFSPVRCISLL